MGHLGGSRKQYGLCSMDRMRMPVYLVTGTLSRDAVTSPTRGCNMIAVTAPTGNTGHQVLENILGLLPASGATATVHSARALYVRARHGSRTELTTYLPPVPKVLGSASASDAPPEAAFSAIPRERFLGPSPSSINAQTPACLKTPSRRCRRVA